MRCLAVSVVNNNALEKNYEYSVILTTSDMDVFLERALSILTVIDDDSM